jgi:hypothetical protein
MSVEADFMQANQGLRDGGSQVFWTIGSDHKLCRIELLSDRAAIAIAANTAQPVLWPVQLASGAEQLLAAASAPAQIAANARIRKRQLQAQAMKKAE